MMNNPYRTSYSTLPEVVRTTRHRLRRFAQRVHLRVRGTFVSRHPFPCPDCGLRGFAKLVQRTKLQVHARGTVEWMVQHRCCDVIRDPWPSLTLFSALLAGYGHGVEPKGERP